MRVGPLLCNTLFLAVALLDIPETHWILSTKYGGFLRHVALIDSWMRDICWNVGILRGMFHSVTIHLGSMSGG